MKTIVVIGVVALISLATILGVFMVSIIGTMAVSVLLELWDFTWDTTFHSCIHEQDIVDNIMKYWMRFISIIYIPAVIYTRVNYNKEILKAFE